MRLEIPDQSSNSSDAEMLRARNRDCVRTASTNRFQHVAFSADNRNRPVVYGHRSPVGRPYPGIRRHDLISVRSFSSQLVDQTVHGITFAESQDSCLTFAACSLATQLYLCHVHLLSTRPSVPAGRATAR